MIHNTTSQPYIQTAAINIKPVTHSENQIAQTIPSIENEVNELKNLENTIQKKQQTLQAHQQSMADTLQRLENKKTDAMQKKLNAESAQLRFEAAQNDAVKIINSYLVKTGCQVIPEPGSAAWHQAVVGEKKKLYCFYSSDSNKKNCYDKLKLHYDTYYQTWHQEFLKASKDKESAEQIHRSADQQIATIRQKIALEEKQLQQLQDSYQQQLDAITLLHNRSEPLLADDKRDEKSVTDKIVNQSTTGENEAYFSPRSQVSPPVNPWYSEHQPASPHHHSHTVDCINDLTQPALPRILITDSDATENPDTGNPFSTPTQSAKYFNVYMHHTDEENLDSIHKTGLYPAGPSGHQKGIGDEDGNCCADGVYVVQPGKMIYDPRPGIALVVSVESPQPDVNYHNGEAGIFYPKNETNNLPPVREAQEDHCQPTYSLTLPITPETQSGLRRFLPQKNLNQTKDASDIVLEKFKENFPIWSLDKDLCKTVPEKHDDKGNVADANQDSISDYDSL